MQAFLRSQTSARARRLLLSEMHYAWKAYGSLRTSQMRREKEVKMIWTCPTCKEVIPSNKTGDHKCPCKDCARKNKLIADLWELLQTELSQRKFEELEARVKGEDKI